MNRAVLLFIVNILYLSLLSCSDNVSGGSAGEIGNPKVAVIVVSEIGAPVESVSVVVLESIFNPLRDNSPNEKLTDSLGFVLIDLPDTGTYIINGRNNIRSSSFISLPISFSENIIDTVYDTLKGFGAINIILPDSIETKGKYFYLAGTHFSASLSDAVKTNHGLIVTIDSVPEGVIPAIILFDTITVKNETIVADTMTVIKDDSSNIDISVISTFLTSSYLQDNALAVRGVVLDSSGLRWIACSSAIIYETAPLKWATYILADNSYSGDQINSVLIDRDDVVWFGGNGGIIRHFNDSVGAYWQFWNSSHQHISNDTIIAMSTNSAGNSVWVVTPGGITTYRDGDTAIIGADSSNVDISKITTITEAKRNEAWVGTSDGNLVNLLENNGMIVYLLDSSGIDTCSILSMDEDNDTTLWIVTDKKVIRFFDGGWEIVDPSLYCNLEAKEVAVNRLDNSIWFLSNSGLCRYDNNGSSLIYSEDFDPPLKSITFPSNSIEGIGYVGMRKGVVEIK